MTPLGPVSEADRQARRLYDRDPRAPAHRSERVALARRRLHEEEAALDPGTVEAPLLHTPVARVAGHSADTIEADVRAIIMYGHEVLPVGVAAGHTSPRGLDVIAPGHEPSVHPSRGFLPFELAR